MTFRRVKKVLKESYDKNTLPFLIEMAQSTAILYFTRTTRDEVSSKNFHARPFHARQIADFLIKRSRTVVEKSGFQVYEIDSLQQVGNTPNERFNHAIQTIFELGHKNVIAVGNDCPQLTVRDLLQAARTLKEKQLVIGPDLRGGAFLIGFTKSTYAPEIVLNTRWSSRHFTRDLAGHFSKEEIGYLDPLMDVNETVSTLSLKKVRFRKRLIAPLINLIAGFSYVIFLLRYISNTVQSSVEKRGPPFAEF